MARQCGRQICRKFEKENGFSTSFGEWYLDRNEGTLYLAPLPGATPETFVAVAPVLQDLLRIEGDPARGWVEHVTFRGLAFAHTEWYFPPGSNMVGLRPEKTTDEPYLRADVGGCAGTMRPAMPGRWRSIGTEALSRHWLGRVVGPEIMATTETACWGMSASTVGRENPPGGILELYRFWADG